VADGVREAQDRTLRAVADALDEEAVTLLVAGEVLVDPFQQVLEVDALPPPFELVELGEIRVEEGRWGVQGLVVDPSKDSLPTRRSCRAACSPGSHRLSNRRARRALSSSSVRNGVALRPMMAGSGWGGAPERGASASSHRRSRV
jgi:hypothetical protein